MNGGGGGSSRRRLLLPTTKWARTLSIITMLVGICLIIGFATEYSNNINSIIFNRGKKGGEEEVVATTTAKTTSDGVILDSRSFPSSLLPQAAGGGVKDQIVTNVSLL